MRYILNSAVITAPGSYRYRLVTADEARTWASSGYTSTVGYPQTAQALEILIGQPVPVDRRMIYMLEGDEALVFRLESAGVRSYRPRRQGTPFPGGPRRSL